jgi:hypothetical protein
MISRSLRLLRRHGDNQGEVLSIIASGRSKHRCSSADFTLSVAAPLDEGDSARIRLSCMFPVALALVAVLYSAVGQAGGTGYVALMGLAGFWD